MTGVQAIVKRIVLGAALLVVVTGATPAAALCAAPPPMDAALDGARYAFVGTVTEITNDGRWATVEVEEVWKGDVAAVVEVRGGPADPPGDLQAASSIDRSFRADTTYLFVPAGGDGKVFDDNSCSSTTRFGPDLEHFRPAAAETPDPGIAGPGLEPPPQSSSDPWWAVAGLLAAAVAGLATWRRRSAS